MTAFTMPTDADALLTESEAADALRLSIRTLQAWRLKEFGPNFVRVGRAIRYRRGDIVAWVRLNTFGGRGESDSRAGSA